MPRSRFLFTLLALVATGNARPDPRYEKPALVEPTRFFEIRGTLDPRTDIRLFVEYRTTAPGCRLLINRLEGVDSDRLYRHTVPVERTGGAFRAAVPLDLVPPGECGWRAGSVEYVALVDGVSHAIPVPPSPLVWFRGGEYPGTTAPPPVRIVCGPQRFPRMPFSTAGDGPECESSGGGDRFVSPEALSIELDVTSRPASR